MNDTPPTLADRLNSATSFRGAVVAILIAVLTTAQGGKVLDRIWPDKTIQEREIAANVAQIKSELEQIRWCLMRQFGIETKEVTK
jgi:hypothetical protein